MNIWMTYIKQIYTLSFESLFGALPLRKVAQLQSPRAHSFNQSLSWLYIFVNHILGYLGQFQKTENIEKWCLFCLRAFVLELSLALHGPPGIRFIANSKTSQIWCIMGLKRGKVDALWDTFCSLVNPTMHEICDILLSVINIVIENSCVNVSKQEGRGGGN